MQKWGTFHYNGHDFDLSHLDPCTVNYVQPASRGKPARTYKVHVGYSHHCFTSGLDATKGYDPRQVFRDPRNGEKRLFDFDRYELSRHLPLILQNLGSKKVSHAKGGKFFVVRLVDKSGEEVEYEVYFKIYKTKDQRGWLNLFVHSAYVRFDHPDKRPKYKPISLFAIMHLVQQGKTPRVP